MQGVGAAVIFWGISVIRKDKQLLVSVNEELVEIAK
jgi:hypothetical protein